MSNLREWCERMSASLRDQVWEARRVVDRFQARLQHDRIEVTAFTPYRYRGEPWVSGSTEPAAQVGWAPVGGVYQVVVLFMDYGVNGFEQPGRMLPWSQAPAEEQIASSKMMLPLMRKLEGEIAWMGLDEKTRAEILQTACDGGDHAVGEENRAPETAGRHSRT